KALQELGVGRLGTGRRRRQLTDVSHHGGQGRRRHGGKFSSDSGSTQIVGAEGPSGPCYFPARPTPDACAACAWFPRSAWEPGGGRSASRPELWPAHRARRRASAAEEEFGKKIRIPSCNSSHFVFIMQRR